MEKSFFFIFILKSGRMRLYYLNHGTIAQWLEQVTHNHLVAGSNPAGPTIFFAFSSVYDKTHNDFSLEISGS